MPQSPENFRHATFRESPRARACARFLRPLYALVATSRFPRHGRTSDTAAPRVGGGPRGPARRSASRRSSTASTRSIRAGRSEDGAMTAR
jgi:hypothetical protein